MAGGRIAAVGTGLDAPGARDIGARGMSVAPAWSRPPGTCGTRCCAACLRAAGGGPAARLLPVSPGPGQAFTDDDNYQGTLLACAEAVNSGITTVHNWPHNVRGAAHVDTVLAGGRILKRGGALVTLDGERISVHARAA